MGIWVLPTISMCCALLTFRVRTLVGSVITFTAHGCHCVQTRLESLGIKVYKHTQYRAIPIILFSDEDTVKTSIRKQTSRCSHSTWSGRENGNCLSQIYHDHSCGINRDMQSLRHSQLEPTTEAPRKLAYRRPLQILTILML